MSPKIFTGAVNIRNPRKINFYNLREYTRGPHEESKLERDRRSGGKMMVNEYERCCR